MHPVRIGRIVRTLRRRRGWRQLDLARRAGVSQQTGSRIERGRIGEVSFVTLERLLRELEAELELNVRWRGGEIDRVVDEGHAHLVATTIQRLEQDGWMEVAEVTYQFGRDRGSIDVFGFHHGAKAVLVVEVKPDVTSAEATLRRQDEKVRHAADIARSRFGWDVRSVSRLLVLPDASTARRRVDRYAALFDRVYPLRGLALRKWLREPATSTGGLLFLPVTHRASDRRDFTSRRRIQRVRRHGVEHETRSPEVRRHLGFIDSTGEHSLSE